MRLVGHHALVTGGGTGIGAAVARALAAEGAKLTLVGRRRDKLEEVGSEDFDALVAPADVTRPEEVAACFAIAREAQGPITILINNAGAAESAPFARVTGEAWRRTMAVNLDALLFCCQAALPDLLEAEFGRIVTIASTAGLKGYAYSAPMSRRSTGRSDLPRARGELAKTRVTVNARVPGLHRYRNGGRCRCQDQAKTGRGPDEARAELARFNPQGASSIDRSRQRRALAVPSGKPLINGQAIAVAGGEVM